jgi:hypothetical protein
VSRHQQKLDWKLTLPWCSYGYQKFVDFSEKYIGPSNCIFECVAIIKIRRCSSISCTVPLGCLFFKPHLTTIHQINTCV